MSEKTKFKHRVLAIDHSLNSTGVAVIAVYEEQPIILHVEEIKAKAKETYGEKLHRQQTRILELIELYEPEYFTREQSVVRFGTSTGAIFRVVGMIDLTLMGHIEGNIEEMPIGTVKKVTTGYGKAEKEDMELAVKQLFQIDDDDFFRTPRGRLKDDMVDACAIGYTFLKKKKLL